MYGGELPTRAELPVLGHVVEVREELIELLLRERIELVVVAARAAERQAQEHRGRRVHAIDDVFGGVSSGTMPPSSCRGDCD